MFTKFLVASVLASAAFATECTRTYTVKEGDWCNTISQAQNVSTYQLSTVNADKINDACTNLEIGQELCLGTKGQDCTKTYNVVKDDTCDKIIMGAGINATMLYTNNPQIDDRCSNILIGQVLCVANEYLAPKEVPGRQYGAPAGEPAGSPSPTPYVEAKQKANKATASNNNTTSAYSGPDTDSSYSAPEKKPDVPLPGNGGDDDDLPECEDPNDDGY
ncbi:unnamed protein product [Rhizoctonia solani]|uniref:LysM domain-containing protein n=3 Tax=Rhizoctonia solani TaxID=456999 RepID=A0A8H3B0M4_9AGAM|nr:carbohydrate-binding module family 50 protein [Rhizoctonia solani AG-3 Rhs1AP]KEP49447.1 carbohydrate-binding module family 50 protein [Rhizoctonia solani 123E]CAE6444859.1 unnamed protein product [Rhizoctonia solani]